MRLIPRLCFLIGLGCLPFRTSASTPGDQVKADQPAFTYMGRFELSGGKAQMGFPAVAVRFKYRGAAPTLLMTAETTDCYFNLACNGWDPVMIHLNKGLNQIDLPTSTAPSEGWIIELMRRTESWMGTASFDGVIVPTGCELLAPPDWPAHKLMFIGDSLTCGEYDERFPPENDKSARTTNAARSYGMLLGKWLNAQVHLIAYGGRGIVRNWDGRRDVNTVPVFFERTLPDQPESKWDHNRYQPDVVVINDGTDHDHDILSKAELDDAYTAFVTRVRSVYPRAYILISESGFQPNTASGKPTDMRDALLKTLEAVVKRRHETGDLRIRLVHTGYFPGTPTDPHLIAFQQEQIALDFLGPIKEVSGW
jgi:hypothetical protein